MTESNTNDRRFWMVVAKVNDKYQTIGDADGLALFDDEKYASKVAEQFVECSDNVICSCAYTLEAVSRYSIPAPRVVKQNLHIPPITAREDNKND